MVYSKYLKSLTVKWVAALCLFASTPLYAFDLGLVGSATYGRPYVNSALSNGFSQQVGYGGGMLADFELTPYFSLQTGLLLVNRYYGVDNGPNPDLPFLQIPLELKFWMFPWLAIGGGAYYSAAGGDSSGWPSQTFTNYGLKNRDYGILVSLSTAIPLSPWTSFYVEGQYINSVQNALSAPHDNVANYYFRDAQFLVGFRFRELLENSSYSREYTISSKRRYY